MVGQQFSLWQALLAEGRARLSPARREHARSPNFAALSGPAARWGQPRPTIVRTAGGWGVLLAGSTPLR